MTTTALLRRALPVVTLVVSAAVALEGRAPTAKERYEAAQAQEATARAAVEQVPPTADTVEIDRVVKPARRVAIAYEGVVRRFPSSGYSDNALLQAGALSQWIYARYGRAADRVSADRYYAWLVREYPNSPLKKQARAGAAALETLASAASPAAPAPAAPVVPVVTGAPAAVPAAPGGPPSSRTARNTAVATRPAPAAPVVPAATSPMGTAVAAASMPAPAQLRAIEREVLDTTVRITLALDREATFAHEVIDGPPRAFVDLFGTVTTEALKDASLKFDGDGVRQVRVGRRSGAVRVVLDLETATKVSVFTLYNPYRVVIDAERPARPALAPVTRAAVATADVVMSDETRWTEPAVPAVLPPDSDALPPLPAAAGGATVVAPVTTPAPTAAAAASAPTSVPSRRARVTAPVVPAATTAPPTAAPPASAAPWIAEPADDLLPAEPVAPGPAPAPGAPSRNADGTFSLARQLGLGISRIVIDPGHGGHDPGTPTAGSTEARIVLDIALRLEKLLKADGLDVVLTRRTDVFVPLEERTAIANREGADLFLSIHANSGRDPKARGVEVYYLSFASNPEAEAVAARENVTSTGGMHNLPSIVRAIALNNKLDESRDLAQMVQGALTSRLAQANTGMRSRGVKKAPFVVLIGAQMPSVLAEIGFITNKPEVALLKTPAYRQKIAESLQAAVVQYQRALKRQTAVATR
ncbi:MAG: N-acetylmuramoyl-L-alanine amidase [Vicinamibacterales bacterium]